MTITKSHYDHLIIGFGKAGKTLAAHLAKQGKEVALIEQSDKMYGGSCINIACIPTKSLITSAENGLPYEKAFHQKNELTGLLRKKNLENLEKLPLVSIITGRASFVSPREVKVNLSTDDTQISISATNIFINTGSLPFIPEIEGIQSSGKVFSSTSLMEQDVLPAELLIIGAGFIGLEFADMYAKFGSKVTVLDQNETFLPREDRDIADEILKVLKAKNIDIVSGSSVQRIKDTGSDTVAVTYTDRDGKTQEVNASAMLLATGRKPNTEDLNLAAAGVAIDERGYIRVDEYLKTSSSNIWALGDINGGPQFTYISLDDFRIIRDQLSEGYYTSVNKRPLYASSVFITPQLAHIGLRESEAINKGYTIKVGRLPAAAIPRARILNNTNGLLKTIVDSKTNKILGCTLFCVEANEMINTIQVAMNAGLDYRIVRDGIYTHPSMTEAFNDLFANLI